MPKSTNTCNNILALIYNATAWANIADNAASSPITNIYVALATASYTATSTMSSNEATYTNYARQAVARSTAGWTAPSAKATSNAAQITFPQCGASGNTITSAACGKASGASDIFHYGDLNASISVSNLIQPVFAISSLSITES